MKISVKRFFNNAAKSYNSSAEIQKIIAKELASMLNKKKAYKNILEIGTGSGFLTENLFLDLSFDKYIHIDIAYDFLKTFKNSDKHMNKMEYINADVEFLPLKNNVFDLLLSSSTLQWLENPKITIFDLINGLKNTSEFYFSIFGEGTFFEMKEISKITGFGSVMDMKNSEFYKSILSKIPNISYDIAVKDYIINYNSVIEFLKHHKKTGARYTSNSKPKGKSSFNAFCQLYKDIFEIDGKIPVTYSIIYIKGIKYDN
jgi:malonyl-CoA O-methyltransferase